MSAMGGLSGREINVPKSSLLPRFGHSTHKLFHLNAQKPLFSNNVHKAFQAIVLAYIVTFRNQAYWKADAYFP